MEDFIVNEMDAPHFKVKIIRLWQCHVRSINAHSNSNYEVRQQVVSEWETAW